MQAKTKNRFSRNFLELILVFAKTNTETGIDGGAYQC